MSTGNYDPPVPTEDSETEAAAKLRAAGVGEAGVQTFLTQLRRVIAGERGALPESDLRPVTDLEDAEGLDAREPEEVTDLLGQAVMIKLNGGLGTSMGLDGPKALLPVKDGLTFLDVIARQVAYLRDHTGSRVPLVLMNSFATQAPSRDALAAHPLEQGVPRDFLQNKVPKLRVDTLEPVRWPADPELEWSPPGHGDLYTALVTSGMLVALLEAGHRYAFVSNADNLGATLAPELLAWFAGSGAPFAMEVADRTAADRKGGHLASRRTGAHDLVLRELAQTSAADREAFQDIERHRYFNTNNLWLDLRALDDAMRASDGILELPLIVNEKTVDPRDPDSPAVLQLETAMGAAIDVLDGAVAIRVPRTRFGPVKTTNDLLAVRSDAYVLGPDGGLALDARRDHVPPVVDLDDRYRFVANLDARFAEGPPSLVACDRLTVEGDVRFGADVIARGDVLVRQEGEYPISVPSGTVLDGTPART